MSKTKAIYFVIMIIIASIYGIFYNLINIELITIGKPPISLSAFYIMIFIVIAQLVSLKQMKSTRAMIKQAILLGLLLYAVIYLNNYWEKSSDFDSSLYMIVWPFIIVALIIISLIINYILFHDNNGRYGCGTLYTMKIATFIAVICIFTRHGSTNDWVHKMNRQLVEETIQNAIQKRSQNECNQIHNIYFIMETDRRNNLFKETAIDKFSDTAITLCNMTVQAIEHRDRRYCHDPVLTYEIITKDKSIGTKQYYAYKPVDSMIKLQCIKYYDMAYVNSE